MPNRMFDPVSNPFAIQNLLEKKVETFIEQRDERAEAVFTFDSVVMANPVHAFSEQTIEDPAAAEPQGFQADWMDTGHDFAGEAQAASGDFVAGSEQAPAAFSADAQEHKAEGTADDAPAAMQAGATEPAAAMPDTGAEAEAVAAAVAEATAQQPDTGVAGASAEQQSGDIMPSSLTAETASAGTDTDNGSQAGADTEPDVFAATAAADTAAAAQAIAMADAAESIAQAAQADVTAGAAQDATESATEAPMPVDAQVTAPAAAPSGITEDELHAQLEAAREEGRAEVRAELEERIRTEAHRQGRDEGEAAGYAKAKDELGKEYEDKIAQMQSMIDALQALSYNPDAMFEPMKTLSVHFAEQLVRGELTQSPQAISRLVDNCLRELNASGEKAVIIHLHPEDIEQYKPQAAQFGDALILRADPKLERGSVRASLEGSVVEDLIQRRVAGLKKGLMQAPAPSWRANAGRLSDRIADGQFGSRQVEDVTIAAARKDAGAHTDAKAEAKSDAKLDAPTGTDSVTEATAAAADNTDA